MNCKPVYRGKVYDSEEALKAAIAKDYKLTKTITMKRDDSDPTIATIHKIIDIHHKIMSNPDYKVQKQISSALTYGFFKDEYNINDNDTLIKNTYDALFPTDEDKANNKLPEFIDKLYSGGFASNKYFLSDMYQLDYFKNGSVGKLGIAVFSTASVFNAYTQLANDKIVLKDANDKIASFSIGGVTITGDTFSNTNNASDPTLNKSKIIEWYQSTAVDEAKLNKMGKVNVNKHTIDIINFMNQLGYKDEVIWFINQPIIRDYVAKLDAEQSRIGKNGRWINVKDYIRRKYRYKEVIDSINADEVTDDKDKVNTNRNKLISRFNKFSKSKDNLLSNIVQYADKANTYMLTDENETDVNELTDEKIEWLGEQLAILDMFDILSDYGKDMKNIAIALNIDSKGIGKDVIENINKMQRIVNVVDNLSNKFNGIEKVIGDVVESPILDENGYDKTVKIGTKYFIPKGIIGSAIARSMFAASDFYGSMFPQYTKEFNDMVNHIVDNNGLTKDDVNISKVAKAVSRSIKRYGHAYFIGKYVDVNVEQRRLLIDFNDDSGSNESLATIVSKFQRDSVWAQNNAFIAALIPKPAQNKNEFSTIEMNNISDANTDDIVMGLADALKDDVILFETTNSRYTTRDLVKDLLIYSEISGGIQSFTQIVKLLPNSYKKILGMPKHLSSYMENIRTVISEDNEFNRQFMQHNPNLAFNLGYGGDKYHFVTINDNGEYTKADNVFKADHVTIPIDYSNNGASIRRGSGTEESGDEYAEFISYITASGNKYLFQLSTNENGKALLTKDGELIYEKIHVLGSKGISEYEYGRDYTGDPKTSVRFDANRRVNVIKYTIPKEDERLITDVLFEERNHKITLSTIAANAKEPFLAYMAKHFVNANFYNDVLIRSTTEILEEFPELKNRFNIEKSAGARLVHKGKTYLLYNKEHLDNQSRDKVFQDMMHEYMHILFEDSLRRGKQDIAASKNSYHATFFNQMNGLYEEAVEYARTVYDSEFIDSVINKKRASQTNKNIKFSNKEFNLQGLGSLSEFVAEIMSNPEFIRFLGEANTTIDVRQGVNRSILSRILSVIVDLLRAMNIKIKRNSISHIAISQLLSFSQTHLKATNISKKDVGRFRWTSKKLIRDDYIDYVFNSHNEDLANLSMDEKEQLVDKYYNDYKSTMISLEKLRRGKQLDKNDRKIKSIHDATYSDVHLALMKGEIEQAYYDRYGDIVNDPSIKIDTANEVANVDDVVDSSVELSIFNIKQLTQHNEEQSNTDVEQTTSDDTSTTIDNTTLDISNDLSDFLETAQINDELNSTIEKLVKTNRLRIACKN